VTTGSESATLRLRGIGRERLRFLPRVLAAEPFGLALAEERPLRVEFFDTERALLRQCGVLLRLEVVGGEGQLALELSSGARPVAEEFPLSEGICPVPDDATEAVGRSAIAGALADALGAVALRRCAALRGVRQAAAGPEGGLRLTVDVLEAEGTGPEGAVVELLLSGGVCAERERLAEYLAEKLDLAPAHRSVMEAVCPGVGSDGVRRFSGFGLRAEDRFVDAAYRVLGRCFERMRWNEPGARLGLEPECLHDMRVATRRLRAALKVFAPALPPKKAAAIEKHLRWLAAALGPVRDLDVLLERFESDSARVTPEARGGLAQYRELLWVRRRRARREMRRVLASRRYERLLRAMERFLGAGPPRRPPAAARRPVLGAASAVIRERLSSVLDLGRQLSPDAPDAELHQLRIRCKRLRYACDCFAELHPRRAARSAKRVARLQETLGAHQDAVAACGLLSEMARRAPRRRAQDFDLAMGQLTQCRAQDAAAARQDFFRRWKKFARKKTRRLLTTALKP